MPSDTFFRLPEEKRARLIDAAWEEFTAASYADASINKIILKARIPRGSFYQYFTDKEDLFLYLLEEVKEHILAKTSDAIVNSRDGLFEVAVLLFEELLRQNVMQDTIMKRYVQVLNINPRMDLQQFCVAMPQDIFGLVMARTDLESLREKDEAYLQQVVEMIVVSLGAAIIRTLIHPEREQEEKIRLQRQLEIIRYGCCRESNLQTGGTPC